MAENLPSTQSHLEIQDIRDDLVLLKNGNIAMVLETNSLNFELLAEDEQDARILSFSSLLNSLNFPIEIVIRTERADVNDYLERLVKQREMNTSKALRKQMEIYIKFVQNLTVKTEVLNKRFFIVVTTYFTPMTANSSLIGNLVGGNKPKIDVYKNLQKGKDYLFPKREFLIKQFQKMGLKAVQLNSDELIQLFYDIYDPDKVGVKRVALDESDYTAGFVEPLTANLVDEIMGTPTKPN